MELNMPIPRNMPMAIFFINAQCLDLMYFLCIQSKNNPEFLSDRYLNGFHPFVRDVMKAKQNIK